MPWWSSFMLFKPLALCCLLGNLERWRAFLKTQLVCSWLEAAWHAIVVFGLTHKCQWRFFAAIVLRFFDSQSVDQCWMVDSRAFWLGRIFDARLLVFRASWTGQLAQLVKALGSVSKGPGFEPGLAPTHITCLLSPLLAIWNEAKYFFRASWRQRPFTTAWSNWCHSVQRSIWGAVAVGCNLADLHCYCHTAILS